MNFAPLAILPREKTAHIYSRDDDSVWAQAERDGVIVNVRLGIRPGYEPGPMAFRLDHLRKIPQWAELDIETFQLPGYEPTPGWAPYRMLDSASWAPIDGGALGRSLTSVSYARSRDKDRPQILRIHCFPRAGGAVVACSDGKILAHTRTPWPDGLPEDPFSISIEASRSLTQCGSGHLSAWIKGCGRLWFSSPDVEISAPLEGIVEMDKVVDSIAERNGWIDGRAMANLARDSAVLGTDVRIELCDDGDVIGWLHRDGSESKREPIGRVTSGPHRSLSVSPEVLASAKIPRKESHLPVAYHSFGGCGADAFEFTLPTHRLFVALTRAEALVSESADVR